MSLTDYVLQYLDGLTKEQLQAKVDADESLVAELRRYEWQVRLAKRYTSIDVDGQELMRRILRERPSHGQILYGHRDWYDRQMRELKQYIDSL